MLADRVRMGVYRGKAQLLNPNNVIFRHYDNSIIVEGNTLKIVSIRSELGGYIIPVEVGKSYKITFDYTGSLATNRVLAFATYPTNVLNYVEQSNASNIQSGFIWTCPTGISHIVFGAYGSAIATFSNIIVEEVEAPMYYERYFPAVNASNDNLYLTNSYNNKIWYKVNGSAGFTANGTLNIGNSIQILDDSFEKLRLNFLIDGKITANYQSTSINTKYPLTLILSDNPL